MQKAGALIERLQQQYHQCVSNSELAVTAQFLLAELQKNQQAEVTGYVTVIMPFTNASPPSLTSDVCFKEVNSNGKKEPEKPDIIPKLQTPEINEAEKIVNADVHVPAEEEVYVFKPEKMNTQAFISIVAPQLEEKTIYSIPTFALKQQELNDRNAVATDSLHDKYKNYGEDVAVLNEPVKDLYKAIGINDRYRFISELFRNDITMYERSIKTINTFSVLSEAELWINRELKLKVGWKEESETVKEFDYLVRRRFSSM